MKKRSLILLTSILSIVVCIALAAGITFAVLTSETKINISIKSGLVDVSAEIVDFKLYSAKHDAEGTLVDEHGATYSYAEYTSSGRFANGGSAEIDNSGTISFKNVAAGDKVEFKINLKNQSNIKVKYNSLITLVGQDENNLYDLMELSVATDTTETNGTTGDKVTLSTYRFDDNSVRSGWTSLDVGESGSAYVSIALPIDAGNIYKGRTAKLRCTIAAIQSTTPVSGVAVVDGFDCLTIKDAVSLANDGDLIEIVRGTTAPEGEIEIKKSLTLATADSILYSFTGVKFVIKDGGALTLDGLKFLGNSGIDASNASQVTVKNCVLEVAPDALFDEGAIQDLPRAAFIASTGVQQSGVCIMLENNTFIPVAGAENAAVVYAEGAVADGSYIRGNVFGTEEAPYSGYAVEILSATRSAAVEISGNTFYGAKAVNLNQKNSTFNYTLRAEDNEIYTEGPAVLVSVEGNASVEIYDSNSKVNGSAVSFDNFELASSVLFCGISVTYDHNGLVSGGEFKLISITAEDFMPTYVSSTAQSGDVTLNND